jgi:hypothetical protein
MGIRREWIDELHRDNLCMYFILPLVRLSPDNFVKPNIVNAYLTTDGKKIIMQVISKQLLSIVVGPMHPNYVGEYTAENTHLFVYSIEEKWAEDVKMFMQGKFSKFSNEALEEIYLRSGLEYQKIVDGGKVVTDARLLALTRHPALQKAWEDYLGMPLHEDAELLSTPCDAEYLDWNEFFEPKGK